MKTLYMGIDPGATGAVGCIDGETLKADAIHLEFQDKDVDVDWLRKYIHTRMEGYDITMLSLEKVNGDDGLSGSSAFNFGKTCGMIRAVLLLMCIDFELRLIYVQPKIWKKEVLKGTDMSKKSAITFVQSMYPSCQLILPRCRVPSEDLAESICMAEYSRLKHQGK